MVKQLFPVTFDRDGGSKTFVKDFTPAMLKNDIVINDDTPITAEPEAAPPEQPTKRAAKS